MKNLKQWARHAVCAAVVLGSGLAHAGSYEDFFIAVTRDNGSSLTSLLSRGFDPNTLDAQGQPALMLAMRDGSLKIAQALLASPQLKVDTPNAADETPLMMAALRGNLDWTRRLIDRGAAINRKGWTPLHYAASSAESSVAELLLQEGATVDAESPNGTTPLMMAAGYGSDVVVDMLLKRGADRTRKNQQGLDAAAFAMKAGRDGLAQRLAASAPNR
jgi:hypothetical protein